MSAYIGVPGNFKTRSADFVKPNAVVQPNLAGLAYQGPAKHIGPMSYMPYKKMSGNRVIR